MQETRSKEVASGQAPENRPLQPSRDAGGEQGGAVELGSQSYLDDLVQGASCQAIVRQALVDG